MNIVHATIAEHNGYGVSDAAYWFLGTTTALATTWVATVTAAVSVALSDPLRQFKISHQRDGQKTHPAGNW